METVEGYKPGFYWVVMHHPMIGTSIPRIAEFARGQWFGSCGGPLLIGVEVISDRLEPPVRFEVETVPG